MDKSKARERFYYIPETGILTNRIGRSSRSKAGDVPGYIGRNGYQQIYVDGKIYYAHRLIWLHVHGAFPPEQIDHINGDRTDNRIENLRAVNNQENHRNERKSKNNTSGATGVFWAAKISKWRGQIRIGKKNIHLGVFDNWFDAVCARKSAEKKYGFHPNHGRA